MDTNHTKSKHSILITGGAGFIGSSLCHFLLDKNNRVICLDNFDDFYSENSKLKNIQDLQNKTNFQLVRGDIRDKDLLDKLFFDFKIDIVVHLAAKAGVRSSIANIRDYFDVNVNGTICLLEGMKKANVKNFIFASSSSVYGNQSNSVNENDITNIPVSPYASSKITGELLTYNYHHNFDFNCINLRFFSIYGARQRPDLVIHKFFNQIENNQAITVYGDGSQARDFTHIKDVVTAIDAAVQFCLNTSEKLYETLNIGNNRSITLTEIISLIQTYYSKPIEVAFHSKRKEDTLRTCADISKAQRLLAYVPKVTIKEGIADFYQWFHAVKNQNQISC